MPQLTIDLAAIEHNTRLVASLLEPSGIRLVGVTKACLGNEQVAGAMLAGGAQALADSRWENLASLRRHLPGVELQQLRPAPGPSSRSPVADLFFVSSADQARLLLESTGPGPLRFCLMVETGDGREGVPPELALEEAGSLASLAGAELAGLATNSACAKPEAPVARALEMLLGIREQLNRRPDAGQAKLVSAGGSGLLQLLSGPEAAAGNKSFFDGITELRCGEALLLGRIPTGGGGRFLEHARRDAFLLQAPVLEVNEKGGRPQALIGLGSQDTGGAPLIPAQPGLEPSSVTSDYLAVAIDDSRGDGVGVREGEHLVFIPTYYSLVALMTSPYVQKKFTG